MRGEGLKQATLPSKANRVPTLPVPKSFTFCPQATPTSVTFRSRTGHSCRRQRTRSLSLPRARRLVGPAPQRIDARKVDRLPLSYPPLTEEQVLPLATFLRPLLGSAEAGPHDWPSIRVKLWEREKPSREVSRGSYGLHSPLASPPCVD